MGARFSAPVQTGPEAQPASRIMGTGSFLGVKRPGSSVDHPPASSAEVKERVELYLHPVNAFVANFTFTYPEPVEYSPRFATVSVGKRWYR